MLIVLDDELQQLMVSAAARGRGVGGLLIEEAERQVAAAGYAEIWLAVVPGNDDAPSASTPPAAGRTTARRPTTRRPSPGPTVATPVLRYVKRLNGDPLRGS